MDYKISQEKLRGVVLLFNEQVDPGPSHGFLEGFICSSRNEGQEHQDWIDSASPQEIVDWLVSFHED